MKRRADESNDPSVAIAYLSRKSQVPMCPTDRVSSTANKDAHFALADIRVAAIDLDGVVYQGKTMIAGADAAIRTLRRHGLRIVFATNSSVRTRAEIAVKLRGMGIPVEEDEVVTSAYVASLLIRDIGAKRVFPMGAEGLKQEIVRANPSVVSEPPYDVVVVGMDTALSYRKILTATEAIAGGAIFVACNRDASFPGENGRMTPGCGPIVAAVEVAAGCPPHHVAGKPNVLMLDIVAARHGVRPHEILVVGDGIESDIGMAAAFGCPSALVTPSASQPRTGNPRPTYTVRSLSDLASFLGD